MPLTTNFSFGGFANTTLQAEPEERRESSIVTTSGSAPAAFEAPLPVTSHAEPNENATECALERLSPEAKAFLELISFFDPDAFQEDTVAINLLKYCSRILQSRLVSTVKPVQSCCSFL